MREVAIIGVGLVKIGQHFDKSIRDLFSEAANKALDDAGQPEVESLYIGNMAADEFNQQKNIASLLSDFSGLNGVSASRIENGEASGGSAVIAGFKDVASGLHDFVLVGGVEKMSEAITNEAQAIISRSIFQEYEAMQGLSMEGAAAMIMRYYMHKHNVNHEDIANLAVLDHKNAVQNPYAQLPFEVTIDKIVNSRPLAEPITLMDCAPIGDGAAALVLCPLEKAKQFTDKPVKIAAVAESTESMPLNQRENIDTITSIRKAAEKAYKMARVTPKDIQIAEIFDPYTIMGVLALEDLGFAKKGQATQLLEEGYFSREGEKPINLSGGLKARGHPIGATGVYQAAEVTLTLRGEGSFKLDIEPEIGLTQASSGLGSLTTITVLKR